MISLVICTYNRCDSLKATLNSLARMQAPPDLNWELLVIDNNSQDRTRAVVEEFSKTFEHEVRYVLETQQGLSFARNRGIREARGSKIAFTDDDVTCDRSWLCQINKTFGDFNCMAVGGKIVPVWMVPVPRWFHDRRPYSLAHVIVQFDLGDRVCETTRTPFGANMAFRKEAFTKYGLFRTDLGRTKDVLMIGEESDFFNRLIKAGERIVYTPWAVVYHPVEKARAQKAYYQSWYFNFGRAEVRMNGFPAGAVRYFGVPRYMYRMFAESALRWMFALGPKKRIYHKIQLYRIGGMIAEARKSTTHVPHLTPSRG